jgi:hypothetical protein
VRRLKVGPRRRGGAARTPASPSMRPAGMSCMGVQSVFFLASAEGDDAADGIVRRDADSHPITRDDLDAEAAHAAAQLCENFVALVALHAIQTAAVNRHDSALNIY